MRKACLKHCSSVSAPCSSLIFSKYSSRSADDHISRLNLSFAIFIRAAPSRYGARSNRYQLGELLHSTLKALKSELSFDFCGLFQSWHHLWKLLPVPIDIQQLLKQTK